MSKIKLSKVFILALIILSITTAIMFVLINKNIVNDEGGGNAAKDLFNHKSKYIGDNSNISNLLGLLPYAQYKNGIELSTSTQPYGLKVFYDINNKDVDILDLKNEFYNNALIIFSLIENVDKIEFVTNRDGNSEVQYYDRKEKEASHIDNLYSYSVDLQTFENFLIDKVYSSSTDS